MIFSFRQTKVFAVHVVINFPQICSKIAIFCDKINRDAILSTVPSLEIKMCIVYIIIAEIQCSFYLVISAYNNDRLNF